MVSENTKQTSSSAIARSFKSPLFLVIAICLSVIFVVTLISMFVSEAGLGLILSLVFAGVSTLCAWLLYATGFSNKKLKNLRLYIAYSKVMTTISLVLVCIVGAILLFACIALTMMSDMIKSEIVPMLENDIKPMLEQTVDSMEEFNQSMTDFEEAYADMPQELKDMYGLESAEDMEEFFTTTGMYAQMALDSWDDIMEFLNTGFLTITIIVAIIVAIAITALVFVSKAHKKTSKYIKALANDNNTDKKAPYIVLFIGGGIFAVGGLVCFMIDPLTAVSALAQGAMLILFALFFKEMNKAREEELVADVEAWIAEEEPAEEVATEETSVEE